MNKGLNKIDEIKNETRKYNAALKNAPIVFFVLEEQVQKMCDAAGVKKKKHAIKDFWSLGNMFAVDNISNWGKQFNNLLNTATSKAQKAINETWTVSTGNVPTNVVEAKTNLDKAVEEAKKEMEEFYNIGAVAYGKRTVKLTDKYGVFEQIKKAAMAVHEIKKAVEKEKNK